MRNQYYVTFCCALVIICVVGCGGLFRNASESNVTGSSKSEIENKNPIVFIKTNMGIIKLTLDAEKAPITVKNFLSYVEESFYDGTIFHRVIPDFMIQGGGFTTNFSKKATKSPIKNEATNGLLNKRGTIAMARTNTIESATSQFFINLADNDFLNHKDNTQSGFGYAVFGIVTGGMDVVDKIASVKTSNRGSYQNVPTKDIVIESVNVLKY